MHGKNLTKSSNVRAFSGTDLRVGRSKDSQLMVTDFFDVDITMSVPIAQPKTPATISRTVLESADREMPWETYYNSSVKSKTYIIVIKMH